MGVAQALSESLAQHIRQGVFRPGDRLPSLREFSRSHRVSVTCAMQAYALLVEQGLIVVRDRSGYLVAPSLASANGSPRGSGSAPPGDIASTAEDFQSLVVAVLGSKPTADRISFSAAYPGSDLFPIDELHRELRAATRLHHPEQFVFEDAAGHIALRQRIARLYAERDHAISPDGIVCTTGGIEAVQLALSACARPGVSRVGVESPAFYPLLQALQRFGLPHEVLPTDPRHGLDVDAAIAAMRDRRVDALLLMPTFHNPLGACLDDDAKRSLALSAERFGVAIIENDPYHELFHSEQPPTSIKRFDEAGWVLHCGSFSNTLAPGYNVGWVAAGRFHNRVREYRFFSNMTAGLLPQRAVAALLGGHGSRSSYAQHLMRLRRQLKDRVDFGIATLSPWLTDAMQLQRPQGGFMVWLQLPERCDTMALLSSARREGIGFAPGELYSLHPRQHRNALALNFGWHWNERRIDALQRLGHLVASHPDKGLR